jgi:hypothetical protein
MGLSTAIQFVVQGIAIALGMALAEWDRLRFALRRLARRGG